MDGMGVGEVVVRWRRVRWRGVGWVREGAWQGVHGGRAARCGLWQTMAATGERFPPLFLQPASPERTQHPGSLRARERGSKRDPGVRRLKSPPP